MAYMYDAVTCSTSTLQAESDDFSVFLRQILLRSSSSSSSNLMAQMGNEMQCLIADNVLLENQHCPVQSDSGLDRVIALVESSSGVISSSGVNFPVTSAYFSSSSVGTIDNERDEYDCESKEGMVEEAPVKSAPPPHSSSKRSRAAEAHNLSEKRRRSRINEKMKALQNLIPNSNKMDKVSMLDEAIQYLKQLQLQLQMLRMRGGLSLPPLCLPGVLHPNQFPKMKMGYFEGSGSQNINMARVNFPAEQDISQSMPLGFAAHHAIPKQTSVPNCSSLVHGVASFGWESCHDGSFQLLGSSKGIQSEKAFSCRLTNDDRSTTSSKGVATDMKENTLQACLLGREQSESMRLKKADCEAVMLSQMDSCFN